MTDDKIHSIWEDHMGMGFLDPPMLFARDIITQARAELIAELKRNVMGVARTSDKSIAIGFRSCRAASEFERAVSPNKENHE